MKAIGIDPASGKETCFWHDNDYQFVRAQKVRSSLEEILEESANCMVAWDAPISFNRASYSDRQVDKISRAWVKGKVEQGKLEKSSVNALPFSGLSHWVISCEALGLPYGDQLPGLKLFDHAVYSGEKGQFLIEVHPAVSMACSWLDSGVQEPFPIYKKSKAARRRIVDALGYPDVCIENDDILDAYVAYLMARAFLEGRSSSLCSPMDGSYVLPNGDAFDELSTRAGN